MIRWSRKASKGTHLSLADQLKQIDLSREKERNLVYNHILERCSVQIIASKEQYQTETQYDVPPFLFGYAYYDARKVARYIRYKLQKQGLRVLRVGTRLWIRFGKKHKKHNKRAHPKIKTKKFHDPKIQHVPIQHLQDPFDPMIPENTPPISSPSNVKYISGLEQERLNAIDQLQIPRQVLLPDMPSMTRKSISKPSPKPKPKPKPKGRPKKNPL